MLRGHVSHILQALGCAKWRVLLQPPPEPTYCCHMCAGILANAGLIAAGWFTRFVNCNLAKNNEVLGLQVSLIAAARPPDHQPACLNSCCVRNHACTPLSFPGLSGLTAG